MLERGTALILRPAKQVHTFGMRYPIDVVFLGGGGRVLRVVREMQPKRLTRVVLRARAVVELPAGEAAGVAVGDRLIVERV